MKIENTMEAKLMNCFTHFELIDFIGFAKLLKFDDEKIKKVVKTAALGESNIQDFVVDVVEVYSQRGRKERRELLKIARRVAAQNDKDKEQDSSPTN